MRAILLSLISLFIALPTLALAKSSATLIFSNVENLFEATPSGIASKRGAKAAGRVYLSSEDYSAKLSNIGRVIADISQECGDDVAIVALAEVESREVVEDLVSEGALRSVGYNIVHYESDDSRGIDVAMLYNPARFSLAGSRAVAANAPNTSTRDILTVWGELLGEEMFIAVVHAPSRVGGVDSTQHLRDALAYQLRSMVDSVQRVAPFCNIVIMGDFNDEPTDSSIEDILLAQGVAKNLRQGELFNPFNELFRSGYGTLAYNREWSLFDNIIISQSLLDSDKGGVTLQRSIHDTIFWADIYSAEYLFQSDGYFRGYPFRGVSSGSFRGGYSDHLPVYIKLRREGN